MPNKVGRGEKLSTVLHWQHKDKPSEAAIRKVLAEEGLQAYSWSNGPHDVYGVHDHSYHKVIYVLEGSITFLLPDVSQEFLLRQGDRLELPPRTRHGAQVGPGGVVCLEAHRP
jgi:quercetin dioxygenase-like cupin family protein